MTLPTPDPAFRWSTEAWGVALRCRPLEHVAQHLFTTRQLELRPSAGSGRPEALEGRPAAVPASATVVDARSASTGVLPAGERGWRLAAAAMHTGLDQIMRVSQVHGRTVRVLRRGAITAADARARPEADAQVSNDPDLALAVQVADCVPLLMADPVRGVAAAVHAGWRGTAAGIAAAAVEVMNREFGSDPADIVAAIGPSIGECCYRVGEELLDAFTSTHHPTLTASWFHRGDDDRLRLNLWAANRDQLLACGIGTAKIFTAGLCTQTNVSILDSYRVDGVRAGRMAGLIRAPRVG